MRKKRKASKSEVLALIEKTVKRNAKALRAHEVDLHNILVQHRTVLDDSRNLLRALINVVHTMK